MPDLPSFLVIQGGRAGLLHKKVGSELRDIARQVRPDLRERLTRLATCVMTADYIILPEESEAELRNSLANFVSPPRMILANEEVAGVVASDFPRLPEQNGGHVVPIDPNDFRFKINQGSQKEFGVELAPKPEFTPKPKPSTTDQYLEVCGRAPRRPDASGIRITFVPSQGRQIPMFQGGPVVPEAIKPENALDFACRLTEALKADKKARKAAKKTRIVDAIVGMW